jgi:hypothetical protein
VTVVKSEVVGWWIKLYPNPNKEKKGDFAGVSGDVAIKNGVQTPSPAPEHGKCPSCIEMRSPGKFPWKYLVFSAWGHNARKKRKSSYLA